MARWNNKLPSLQKQIIILLGNEGPLTKNEVSEKLKKSYKNVIFAFKSLQDKKLLEHVGEKKYRNRKFKLFWLTWQGIIEAYAVGVSAFQLKKNTEEVLKRKSEHIDAFFDFLEVLGKKKARKLFGMMDFSNGKPRLTSINIDIMSEREARKVLRVLKKYEIYRKAIIKALQSVIDELS